MSPLRTFVAVATLAILWPSTFSYAGTAEQVFKAVSDSIVTIDVYDEGMVKIRQGSGVIVNERAGGQKDDYRQPWILTNYHVINRALLVVLSQKDGRKRLGQVLYFDAESDLALLTTFENFENLNIPKLAKDITVGSDVFAIGAPEGLGWSISNGIVSATRHKEGAQFVQFTAPVSPGSSGGGLFNSAAELIGVTSFVLKEGQNLNFAAVINNEFLKGLERLHNRPPFRPWHITENDWVPGYFESPGGTQNSGLYALRVIEDSTQFEWRIKHERTKLWDAHGQIIQRIDQKIEAVSKTLSKDEVSDAFMEELSTLPNETSPMSSSPNRAPRQPLAILFRQRDRARADRYQEFPDDSDGWLFYYMLEPDAALRKKSVIMAMDRWPRNSAVARQISEALTNEKWSSPQMHLQWLERMVDSLPSKEKVNKILEEIEGPSISDDEFHSKQHELIKRGITLTRFSEAHDVVYSMLKYLANTLMPAGSIMARDRHWVSIRQKLIDKGWIESR